MMIMIMIMICSLLSLDGFFYIITRLTLKINNSRSKKVVTHQKTSLIIIIILIQKLRAKMLKKTSLSKFEQKAKNA